MPVHDLGYREWSGKIGNDATRWWIIAQTGIKIVLRNHWVRKMILLSLTPTIVCAIMAFGFERFLENRQQIPLFDDRQLTNIFPEDADLSQDEIRQAGIAKLKDYLKSRSITQMDDKVDALDRILADKSKSVDQIRELASREIQEISNDLRAAATSGVRRQMQEQFMLLDDRDALIDAILAPNKTDARVSFWTFLLMSFLKYPQGGLLLLLVGMIAPPLIAKDVRSKEFLLYFSRPINRGEYILGKLAVVGSFVAMITIAPTLLLYLFCILLSPDIAPIVQTWHLPFKIILASLVAIVPTSCLSLALSSLTSETRFAGFAWFAIWILGAGAWLIIFFSTTFPVLLDGGTPSALESQFSMMSIYHTIGNVQRFVFGYENRLTLVVPSILLLVALTAISLHTLWRRVSAPIRI